MSDPLTASDFWPLILPHDERVRLAKIAQQAAARDDCAAAAQKNHG